MKYGTVKHPSSRSFAFRGWLLLAAIAGMLVAAGFYLQKYRSFAVNDSLYQADIDKAARKYGLDSRLVRALIYEESRFQSDRRGKAGEIGLMQITPRVASDWARAHKTRQPSQSEMFNPECNLEIGCWYLSVGLRDFREYKHATELALARYNAGPTPARKWKPENKDGEVVEHISYPSTKRYVTNIMYRYQTYCEENPREGDPQWGK